MADNAFLNESMASMAIIFGLIILFVIIKIIFKAVMFYRKIRTQNDIHAMRENIKQDYGEDDSSDEDYSQLKDESTLLDEALEANPDIAKTL